jgi:hypothetical protein
MAVAAGKDAVFEVVSDGGTQTLSSYATSVSGPAVDAQIAETSTLGDTFKSYIRTQNDPGAITVEGIFQTIVGTILADLGTATAKAFAYYPQGTAAGNAKYSGSCLLTSYETTADRDDAGLFSASFQITSTLTAGTA